MKDKESEHLEFKEAKIRYDFEELTRYCAAIANEGGGMIILYHFLGKKGVHTRKRGLDRETNKMPLFKHGQYNSKEGSRLQELMQVLPACSRGQIQGLLKELEKEGRVHHIGATPGLPVVSQIGGKGDCLEKGLMPIEQAISMQSIR